MEKKDTLYFMFKIDVGNASVQQAREYAAAVNQMVSSKQKPDDQYFEKWFVLPVRDEGTSIELIYPPSDVAREQMEMRYDQFMEELDDILNRRSADEDDEYFEEPLQWPPMSKAELTRRYLAKVDEIATDIDWKTHFGPEEICSLIYDILNNEVEVMGSGFYPVIYCGVKNSNDRIYELEEVRNHLDDLNKACENGRFIGQIGYPIDDNRLEPVNLKNASHVVNSFSIEDGILWANVKVLDTPPGKILQGLLDRNLVVFRPVVEGSVERIGETDYARIKKFLGVHAINVTEDSFNV